MSIESLNDCYQILELESNATAQDVEKAFKELRIFYHPDAYSNRNKEVRQRAEEKSKLIGEAKDILLEHLNFGRIPRKFRNEQQPKQENKTNNQQTNHQNKTNEYTSDSSARAQKIKDEVAEEFRQWEQRKKQREVKERAEKEQVAREQAELEAREKRIAQERAEKERIAQARVENERVIRKRADQDHQERERIQRQQEEVKKRLGQITKTTIKWTILSYPIVGFGGCYVREANAPRHEYVTRHTHPASILVEGFPYGIKAWTNEAIFIPSIILVIGILMAIFTVMKTNKK